MNLDITEKKYSRDPRYYQIIVLVSLFIYGALFLDLEFHIIHSMVIISVALGMQYGLGKYVRLPQFDPKSALISALSLCLLLRSNSLIWIIVVVVITISSKFFIRFRGRHIFNPSNIGLTASMLLTDQIWVSPGQWGHAAFFTFLIACLGVTIIHTASRSDITYAFLGSYILLLTARSFFLGDPLSIVLHQVKDGSLLIFSFFMISDPKTTPNSRSGRILFAFLVACSALYMKFSLYWINSLLWSLTFAGLLLPLLEISLGTSSLQTVSKTAERDNELQQ